MAPAGTAYTLAQLEQMLGLARREIAALIDAGFVSPERGSGRQFRFSFRDVVLLRTAHRLRSAGVPARKVLRALQRLREQLPAEVPLSGLRVTAAGGEVAVHEGGGAWEAESGQGLLDFEVAAAPGAAVSFIERPAAAPPGTAADVPDLGAEGWFRRGWALESGDPAAAEQAYRRAIAADPALADAWLNLGALLGAQGRHGDAAAVYERALANHAGDARLHFNLAVALEDDGRPYDALQRYADCLAREPGFADAHYNAARLHDELGQPQQALRHYSEYRRLSRPRG